MMWGGPTTANWCSCPRCGYDLSGGTLTGDFFIYRPYQGVVSNGYDLSRFAESVRSFSEAAKRNPKWRIWHRPAIAPRSFDRPLFPASVTIRHARLARSATSAAQRRRHKRRMWIHQLRRAQVNTGDA